MKPPLIFMFSGQGSQYYQMGRILFDNNLIFRKWMLNGDKIYHDLTGESVIKHLYNDNFSKSTPFNQTLLTHPAIFMVEYSLLQVLYSYNILPNKVLGTSMGEFAAATVAGIITFETAITAVVNQALCLEQYCEPAGMLAILHNSTLYQERKQINQTSELAAINFPDHFIVSGKIEDLKAIASVLKSEHIASQLLPISQGFHSSLIDNAKQCFLNSTAHMLCSTANIPVISCVDGRIIQEYNQQHLWDIIRRPILFQETIQRLEAEQSYYYIDLGPSGTLATFVKYNLASTSQSKFLTILSPYQQDTQRFENIFNTLSAI